MGQLSHHGPQITLPALPPREPILTPALGHLVSAMANPHPDVSVRGVVLPLFLRRETADALARYDQLARPADGTVIVRWLAAINQAMNKPLQEDEFVARVGEIVDVLAAIPAGFFNAGTKQDAQRQFQWFPGAADLYGLLCGHVREFNVKRRALEDLLATQAPPEPVELSAEERQAILDDFHAKMANIGRPLATEAETRTVETARPRYLTRSELRGTLERIAERDPDFAGAARTRIATLHEEKGANGGVR
jgi:hypothetical protein